MYGQCNECYTRMWTDELHRVQITSATTRAWDGANVVSGWMRADIKEAFQAYPRPVDVPFSVVIPAGLDSSTFHLVCSDMFYKIRDGKSLMGLDYAPPAPAQVQQQPNLGGLVLLAGLGVLALASGSRN